MALVYDVARVFPFLRDRLPGLALHENMAVIGWESGGRITAGVAFEGYNGRNAWVHVAGDTARNWLTRTFIRAVFIYAFRIMDCARISAYVDDANLRSRQFCERFGFVVEALLGGAAADGGDVLIYALWRDDCRYI